MASLACVIIVAFAASLYSWAQKLASPFVNKAFGALVVSVTALFFCCILLLLQASGNPLITSKRVLVYLVLAGIAAFSIDYFTLLAYSRGLALSVGGPISISISIALTTLIGFFLGESISVMKLVGVGLVLGGALILSRFAGD